MRSLIAQFYVAVRCWSNLIALTTSRSGLSARRPLALRLLRCVGARSCMTLTLQAFFKVRRVAILGQS